MCTKSTTINPPKLPILLIILWEGWNFEPYQVPTLSHNAWGGSYLQNFNEKSKILKGILVIWGAGSMESQL